MAQQVLLVTIINGDACAVYLDGKLIIASNLIYDPTETIDYSESLVKGVAESMAIALKVEVNEVGMLGPHKNWDWDSVKSALIARGTMFNGEKQVLNVLGCHYKWLERDLTPEGLIYRPIEENDANISDLAMSEIREAAKTIEHSFWGFGMGAIHKYALVKFSMSLVNWSSKPDPIE